MNLSLASVGRSRPNNKGHHLVPSEHPIRNIVDALAHASRGKARVIVPQVAAIDWAAIAADPKRPIAFTNRAAQAHRLCAEGLPTIAVTGISRGKLAKILRRLGVRVVERGALN